LQNYQFEVVCLVKSISPQRDGELQPEGSSIEEMTVSCLRQVLADELLIRLTKQRVLKRKLDAGPVPSTDDSVIKMVDYPALEMAIKCKYCLLCIESPRIYELMHAISFVTGAVRKEAKKKNMIFSENLFKTKMSYAIGKCREIVDD
jgi:hypothetical protein